MATDPVCGMKIEKEGALNMEWEDRIYYFCAKGCRDEFTQAPEGFTRGIKVIVE